MVAGGYEVNVVHTLVLKPQHNVSQLLNTYLLATFAAAYFVVLAKHTAQVTAGEKQRTRTPCAAYAGLLTKVSGSSG